ncbi:PQQ-binding-like beta-propeller repeat protein [Halomontanus rarus]|uniref:outer membrane protein assembly factor BamB family protein n=1 Tax=Halomontanus rarus TaxID=3034020 RepID=UPI001A994D2D
MTDWNQFRGDRRNSGRRPDLEGPERIETDWSVDFDGAVSCSPVVGRDTVYVGTDRGRLHAVDRHRGHRRWVFDATAAIGSEPVATRDRLYLAASDGTVSALDPATGEREWQYSAAGPLESPLAVADDALFVGDASGLIVLETATGEQRWAHETETPVAGSPAIADDRNRRRVYVGTDAESVRAVDLETGEEAWIAPTDGTIVGGPTVADDRVYVADDAGTLLALDADTGQSWFAYEISGAFTSSVTVVGETAFVGADDEYCHVIETTFGTRKLSGLLFSKKGVPLDGSVRGSPVVAGDVLFVGDSSGTFYGIRVDDADFLWHFTPDRPVVTTPALADDRLYVGCEDGRLACLAWNRDERRV